MTSTHSHTSSNKTSNAPQGILKTQGSNIVNAEGKPVLLHGVGLGGWMNMENFITGYPANEAAQRNAIRNVLGEEKYEYFFDRFLEYFFGPDDAKFLATNGMNLLRLPINYRHFESDMDPFVIKEEGFKHLDRVIELCAQHHIYTIIDLHALPGYQNQEWHSDNPTHVALFWQHKHFQDRVVNLWEAIATRYKDNPWVAGYNPINEPGDPGGEMLAKVYKRIADAIRAIDPDHILYLDGNRYSLDFEMFTELIPNAVYTTHDYAVPGFVDGGPYPGTSRGEYFDKAALETAFLRRTQFMRERNSPIWIGEWGPVYRGEPAADKMRYQILDDQLDIYKKYGNIHWSIWTYKDIGLQGFVYTANDSPWKQRLQSFVEKKARLGVDSWGSVDDHVRDVIQPIEDLFAREFPNYNPFPFGQPWAIKRLVRHILMAEPMVQEFGELFRGLDFKDIDTLLQSFSFQQCTQRTELMTRMAQHPGSNG